MGAASVDLPTIGVRRPMLNGQLARPDAGSGTGVEHERAGARRHA